MTSILYKRLLISFTLCWTLMACNKSYENNPVTPPVDSPDTALDTSHPTVTKMTILNKGYVDTFMYAADDQLSYIMGYTTMTVGGTPVYTTAFSYEYPYIKQIRLYTLGSLSTDAAIKHFNNDSIVYHITGGVFWGPAPESFVLDKNGMPIKGYRFADVFGPMRLARIWTIDSLTGNIVREQATDTLWPWETGSTYTYTTIRNPFYYIGLKNPVYGLKYAGITTLSKHMISTYSITDSIMVESYTYETDSSGKWPIRQVMHNHISGDSTVISYTYKEINH